MRSRRNDDGKQIKALALLRGAPDVARLIEDMLVLRSPHSLIFKKAADKFGVDEKTTRRLIKAILTQWQRQQDAVSSSRKAHMRATLDAFYLDAMAKNKHLAAFQALKELIRLDGLAEPERLKIDLGTMTVESAATFIEEAHSFLSLARQRKVIEATATEIPPEDPGSNGGEDTH